VTTLGDIFRRYRPTYRTRFGASLSESQKQALQAIAQCRIEALGGHVYTCTACGTTRYSYHSCRNRHCPTCQQDATQDWLAQQHELLLPVPYFLVTFVERQLELPAYCLTRESYLMPDRYLTKKLTIPRQ
jgi:hypothetical protein